MRKESVELLKYVLQRGRINEGWMGERIKEIVSKIWEPVTPKLLQQTSGGFQKDKPLCINETAGERKACEQDQ